MLMMNLRAAVRWGAVVLVINYGGTLAVASAQSPTPETAAATRPSGPPALLMGNPSPEVTDLLLLPPLPHVEITGGWEKTELKFTIKTDEEGSSKLTATTLSAGLSPSLAVLDGALYLNLGLSAARDRLRVKSQGQDPVDETSSVTRFQIKPQVAYRLSPQFGVGLGYVHSLEDEDNPDDEPDVAIGYGRFLLSAQSVSGPLRIDAGLKTQSIKKRTATTQNSAGDTQSSTAFRYLSTELSAKAAYLVSESLSTGLFVKYFLYDKDNNDDNPYRSFEVRPLDYWSFGLHAAYEVVHGTSVRVGVQRQSALDLANRTNYFVSANALELGATSRFGDIDAGVRLGWASGEAERNFTIRETPQAEIEFSGEKTAYSAELWAARSF